MGICHGHTLLLKEQPGATPSSLCPGRTGAVSRRALAPPAPASVPVSRRALDVLKDFAPGAQLPVLLYNGEPKTDTVTIEDFLEDKLGPPLSVAGAAPRGDKEPKRGRTGWEGRAPATPLSRVPVPAGAPAWSHSTGSRAWPGTTSSTSSPPSSRTRRPPRMRVRSWAGASGPPGLVPWQRTCRHGPARPCQGSLGRAGAEHGQALPWRRARLAGGLGRAAGPRALTPRRGCPPAALQRSLLRALLRLDEYLSAPLAHELARDPHLRTSRRRFLDGDRLTLADCNLLPKLNIVQVSPASCPGFSMPPAPCSHPSLGAAANPAPLLTPLSLWCHTGTPLPARCLLTDLTPLPGATPHLPWPPARCHPSSPLAPCQVPLLISPGLLPPFLAASCP